MLNKLLRRVLMAGSTIMLGGLLSATLVRYAPGFGTDERQLDARLSRASIEAIRRETAPESSIARYYGQSLWRGLHGDLGLSRSLSRPVRELIAERASVTAALAGKAMLEAWLAAACLILATWMLRAPLLTTTGTLLSGTLLCIPAGGLALLAVILNAPAHLTLALVLFPKLHRYLANLISATGTMAHAITARSKGVGETRVLLWHVLPVIRRELLALAGVCVGLSLSAAIPVEAISGVPGIGQLAWQSAMSRDLPLLVHLCMLVIAVVTLANTGVDLLGEKRGQVA